MLLHGLICNHISKALNRVYYIMPSTYNIYDDYDDDYDDNYAYWNLAI